MENNEEVLLSEYGKALLWLYDNCGSKKMYFDKQELSIGFRGSWNKVDNIIDSLIAQELMISKDGIINLTDKGYKVASELRKTLG